MVGEGDRTFKMIVLSSSGPIVAAADRSKVNRLSSVQGLRGINYHVHNRRQVYRKGFSRYNFRTETEQEDDVPTLQVSLHITCVYQKEGGCQFEGKAKSFCGCTNHELVGRKPMWRFPTN